MWQPQIIRGTGPLALALILFRVFHGWSSMSIAINQLHVAMVSLELRVLLALALFLLIVSQQT